MAGSFDPLPQGMEDFLAQHQAPDQEKAALREHLMKVAQSGQLGSDPASRMSAKMIGGEPMTQTEKDEMATAMGASAGIGGQVGMGAGLARGVYRAMQNKEGLGVFGNALAGMLEGGGAGAVLGALAEHFGGWRPLQEIIDKQAMQDMQPAASGEKAVTSRPLKP